MGVNASNNPFSCESSGIEGQTLTDHLAAVNPHNITLDQISQPIQVDLYENIPLKVGVYSFTFENENNNYTWSFPTNIFKYEDDTAINTDSLSFNSSSLIVNSSYLIVKREYLANTADFFDAEAISLKFIDSVYNSAGVFLGIIIVEDNNPFLDFDINQYRLLNEENVYLKKTNYNYGSLSCNVTEVNYTNNVLSIDYDFNTNTKILFSELSVNGVYNSQYKIGLKSSLDNFQGSQGRGLAVKDLIGNFKNSAVKLFIQYATSVSGFNNRITDNTINNRQNVLLLETSDDTHADTMSNWFNEAYGTYQGQIIDYDNAAISNFENEDYILQAFQNQDIDIALSAGNGISQLINTLVEKSFHVLPVGSNNLQIINITDAIDQFPINYIAVTSRAETDNDGTDPKGTSYGFGTEFNEDTTASVMIANGYTANPDVSATTHAQSPATAIVAGKLKYIKDQTGATWDIVRQAARQTASNANNYNIYRGFGVIDTAAAIALIPTLQAARSLELADYYEATTVMPLELEYADKSLNTPVNKRDLQQIRKSGTQSVGVRYAFNADGRWLTTSHFGGNKTDFIVSGGTGLDSVIATVHLGVLALPKGSALTSLVLKIGNLPATVESFTIQLFVQGNESWEATAIGNDLQKIFETTVLPIAASQMAKNEIRSIDLGNIELDKDRVVMLAIKQGQSTLTTFTAYGSIDINYLIANPE